MEIDAALWSRCLPGCSSCRPWRVKLTGRGRARAEHQQQWQHLPGHLERAVEPCAHRIEGARSRCRSGWPAEKLPVAVRPDENTRIRQEHPFLDQVAAYIQVPTQPGVPVIIFASSTEAPKVSAACVHQPDSVCARLRCCCRSARCSPTPTRTTLLCQRLHICAPLPGLP